MMEAKQIYSSGDRNIKQACYADIPLDCVFSTLSISGQVVTDYYTPLLTRHFRNVIEVLKLFKVLSCSLSLFHENTGFVNLQ